MKRPLRLAALSAILILPFVPSLARADAPSDDQKAAARMFGTDGVRAAMAGDCRTAVDKLTRAEALVHAPTTALYLAKCQIQLGKVLAGTEILNRIINEPLPPNAPEPWVDAKKQAPALLEASAPKIAKLRVHVERPAGSTGDPQVTVDGAAIPSVLLDNDRPSDPGAHHVVATAPGMTTVQTDVTLTEGQTQAVTLRIEALPKGAAPALASAPAPAPAPASAPASAPAAPAPESSGPNRTGAYVVLGIGAAGLVVGTVFGVVALGNKSSLNNDCPAGKNACPASEASTVSSLDSSLNTNAALSTVGLGVGVVGAVLGGYLFFSASSDTPKTGAIDVHPWVGPGSAGIHGSF